MARKTEAEDGRLDEAARAGWLYYVAGNTQNEIAENEQFVIILDSGKSMLPEGYAIPYFTGDSPEEMR